MSKIIYGFLVLAFFYSTVHAQDNKLSSGRSMSLPHKLKKIKISFEEDLIQGGMEKPEASFFNVKKDFNYKKMIKIRENFIPEFESSGRSFGNK